VRCPLVARLRSPKLATSRKTRSTAKSFHRDIYRKDSRNSSRICWMFPATRGRLTEWLAIRGTEPSALFTTLIERGRIMADSPAPVSGRSSPRWARRPARRSAPHGLRHAAITTALDVTRGDVRAVQRLSRHAKVDTVLVYDDARRDLGGEVAKLIAGG
jgi:integrase